jgi:Asp-tRNA(Asn)/Glu-tRNA(Gln) amidotransferase A subunit family amidase
MTPLRLVLAGAAGSAAADFGDQDPRGLTHTIIGSLVVRGNRLTLSNSSSLSGCELHGSSLRARLPAFEDAVGVLRDLGASVTDVELPPLALYNAAAFLIARAEGFAIHEKTLRERPKDYGTLARDRLTIGAYIRRPCSVVCTLRREWDRVWRRPADRPDARLTWVKPGRLAAIPKTASLPVAPGRRRAWLC